ncbi:MAG: AMIN domain-containing protein, partial [Cyanobacteria bacterium J06558_2]
MRFISPLTTIIATTITANLAAPVLAQQLIQITEVNVREQESGIEIIIKTADGSVPQFGETSDNNILFIDFVDAQLNLASGKSLKIKNPAAEIELVTVEEEFAGSVSLMIQGTDSLPQVELVPNSQGGVLIVTTTGTIAEADPSETETTIDVIVTGESPPEPEEYIRKETSIGRGNPTSILDTPQSVQTVTKELIDDQSINNLSDIQRNVSGVTLG